MPACSMLASIVLDVTGTGEMMRMNHFWVVWCSEFIVVYRVILMFEIVKGVAYTGHCFDIFNLLASA